MFRKAMKRSKDRKVFRRTALSGKVINYNPINYRGGIRL